MIARVESTSGSFIDWFNENKCNNIRNRHEQELLCAVIDCLNQHKDTNVALELLCRRLLGVVTADGSGQWEFANAISLHRSAQLVSHRLLRRTNADIIKARAASKGVSDKSADTTSAGTGKKQEGCGGNKSAASKP